MLVLDSNDCPCEASEHRRYWSAVSILVVVEGNLQRIPNDLDRSGNQIQHLGVHADIDWHWRDGHGPEESKEEVANDAIEVELHTPINQRINQSVQSNPIQSNPIQSNPTQPNLDRVVA
jgi:hypothetical protein